MDSQRPQRRGATAGGTRRFIRRPGRKGAEGRHGAQRDEDSRVKPTSQWGRKRRKFEDENIDSDSVSGSEAGPPSRSESDEEHETTDEARLRVAKQYLKQFSDAARGKRREKGDAREASLLAADPAFDSAGEGSELSQGSEDEESDDDIFLDADAKSAVAEQLKRKAEAKKLLSRPTSSVADSIRFGDTTFFKGHKLPITCIALPGGGIRDDADGVSQLHAYTGGKDCCIIRWDLQTGSKEIFKGQRNCFGDARGRNSDGSTSNPCGHFRPVLDVCVAADERVFFSAGADHTVRAWDPRTSNTRCLFELRSHRGPVTGVRFNGSSSGGDDRDTELITCSADKSLKTWSVSCRSVANHFYGHASEVNCMDILQANKPITGGNDGTLRNWKLAQDTHAAFPPLGSCVDSVAMMSPSLFACGTQGGLLALFNSNCKRPLACVRVHPGGRSDDPMAAAATADMAPLRATGSASSVSALCALPLTDALLVGTEGGATQIWQAAQNDRKAGGGKLKIIPEARVQAGGAVTGLCVANDHSFAVAAVSTESRLGRWYKSPDAKNGIRIFPITKQ